jgi:hypothetical protein
MNCNFILASTTVSELPKKVNGFSISDKNQKDEEAGTDKIKVEIVLKLNINFIFKINYS